MQQFASPFDPWNDEFRFGLRRRRQLLRLIAVILTFIGITLLTLRYLLPRTTVDRLPATTTALAVMGGALALGGLVAMLLNYLQGNALTVRYGREAEAFEYSQAMTAQLSARIDDVQRQLKGAMPVTNLAEEVWPPAERAKLVSELKDKIESEATQAVLGTLQASIEVEYRKELRNRDFERDFGRTLQRLSGEVNALGRRGNLNLVIGIVTTVSGLVLLGYFVVLHAPTTADATSFIIHFIPRLSLVIFVELFAFFFLRLYKTTLDEIKYFQNEMTNVETKAIALRASGESVNESQAEVIKNLAQTERNHLLEKGQTTVELERTRLEGEHMSALARTAISAIRGSAEKSGV